MAEWHRTNFRPESGNIDPRFTGSVNYPGNPLCVQNMGVCQAPNFVPTYAPGVCPPVGPSDFPGGNSTNSNLSRPSLTPYMPGYQWSANGNPVGVSNYPLGTQQTGFIPPSSSGHVIPFDASVPPPHPRFPALPSFQQRIPSPGILASDSSMNVRAVPERLEENDREWIDAWIRYLPRRAKPYHLAISGPESKVKVWKVKQSLLCCMSLLKELEALKKELTEGCELMDETQWSQKLGDAEKKKVILEEKLGSLDNSVLQSVKRTLSKRGCKRARQRGRRVLDQELAAARVERRRQLHLEADMWLEEKQAEVDLHKREEMLKKEADAVLWEVRRKQSEGRKILTLLSTLVKLHQVRVKKRDLSTNPALSENEDQFQIIIDKLSSLWERQISEYEVEERALRVMLSESPEGCVGSGTKSRALRATGDLQRSLRLWESTLFGTGAMSEEMLNLEADSCQWMYLQPSKSLEALIENRRQWDQFISTSPSATAIPAGWVIPVEASSKEWKALIGPHVDSG